MASIGLPIVGDSTYGRCQPKKRWNWEQTRALWFSWNGYIDVVSLINFSGWFLFGSLVKSNEWTLDLSDCPLDPHFLALKNSWSQKGPMQHKLPWGAQLAEKNWKKWVWSLSCGHEIANPKNALWKENQPTLSYSCIVWSSPQMGNDPWPLFHDRELFGILGGLTFFLGVRDSSSTADGYSWWIVIFRLDVCPDIIQVKQVIELCYNVGIGYSNHTTMIDYDEHVSFLIVLEHGGTVE